MVWVAQYPRWGSEIGPRKEGLGEERCEYESEVLREENPRRFGRMEEKWRMVLIFDFFLLYFL